MLTIEQALDEAYKNAGSNAYFGNRFRAGVEFAQSWISIDEELPTELENVLFKSEYEGEVLYEVGFLFSGKFYVKNKMPTHWRPIELK